MPVTKSARKAHRQSLRKRERNLVRRAALDRTLKNFLKLLGTKKEEAKAGFAGVQKALDKAAKKGLLEKNTAARKKSRLARLLK